MKLKCISSVFISGEAEDYSPYEERDVNDFIHDLVASVLSRGRMIVTITGSGIGDMVVRNALIYLEENNLDTAEFLSAIPFPKPYDEVSLEECRRLRTKLRRDVIDQTSAAVFLFGNTKDADGKTVLSDGTREEFEIAKESQCLLVPVGVTGYMAQELWKAAHGDFESSVGQFLSYPPECGKHTILVNNFAGLDEVKSLGEGGSWREILMGTIHDVSNILDNCMLGKLKDLP